MSDYLHGAYGEWIANGNIPTAVGEGVVVAVGTAPVQNLSLKEGEGYNVNKPVLVRNIAEAKRLFGYSDDWAKYTLCEAMHHFFETKRVGPLVLINVLDPKNYAFVTHGSNTAHATPEDGVAEVEVVLPVSLVNVQVEGIATSAYTVSLQYMPGAATGTMILTEKTAGALGTEELTITYDGVKTYSETKTPVKNTITIANAEDIILESVRLFTAPETGDPVEKEKGTDFIVSYSSERNTITIAGLTNLGSSAMTVKYTKTNAAGVTNSNVIGTTDDHGQNTGLYAVRDVYPLTGAVPAYLIVPGFSHDPDVHEAMNEVSEKVNGHWDMWKFVDMPLADNGVPLTMLTAAAWKTTNGYNKPTETVYWPMAEGVDGKKYHLSVLAAANFLELLTQYEGVPFHSASNTPATIIKKLWTGAASKSDNRVYDDKIINENLNANGIASAAFVGGRWAIWGAHAADYDRDNADYVNVAETNRMMLMYVSNNFQVRRSLDVDKPMTQNDIDSIVSEEQARLDGLKQMGALIFGEALLDAESIARSDVYSGDFVFAFRVTTTPLAKSLTAVVTWVDDGFSTYFAEA